MEFPQAHLAAAVLVLAPAVELEVRAQAHLRPQLLRLQRRKVALPRLPLPSAEQADVEVAAAVLAAERLSPMRRKSAR